MSADAFHMTGMAPEGEGCFRAMNAALKVAGISPDKIDYVNAHATSTPLGDALESKAIENVFGERALNQTLLVSSTKSMTGHLLGGAGGLEAGITIMAMLQQIAPPTMNLVELDPAVPPQLRPQHPAARQDRLRALQLLRLRRHQRLARLPPLDGVVAALAERRRRRHADTIRISSHQPITTAAAWPTFTLATIAPPIISSTSTHSPITSPNPSSDRSHAGASGR